MHGYNHLINVTSVRHLSTPFQRNSISETTILRATAFKNKICMIYVSERIKAASVSRLKSRDLLEQKSFCRAENVTICRARRTTLLSRCSPNTRYKRFNFIFNPVHPFTPLAFLSPALSRSRPRLRFIYLHIICERQDFALLSGSCFYFRVASI